MENNTVLKKTGNASVIAATVILSVALWNEYTWYEAVVPYATLISFAFLGVALFCFVTPKEALHDPDFLVMTAGFVIAAVNIFMTGSGKGAWLTAADVLLVSYLAGKMRFSKRTVWLVLAYVGFYFFYWTFDVKGYFKGYNTNYGGLVLITGFVFAVTGLIAFKKILGGSEKKGERFLFAFILFMFAWGYNIIAWYRSRCALLGFAVFAVLLLVPRKWWGSRAFFASVTGLFTAGAIAVSLIYVWLGQYARKFSVRIFYKDIISGRNEIWSDLWGAFSQHPLTGIGSSYKINVDWMGGIFEVHNGLLDILIVHGIFVFAAVCYLLVKRLLGLRKYAAADPVSASATAAVFAILATSFMENFFIVPPFLLCLLALIAIAGSV